MNHVVLSGHIRYDPEIIYVLQSKSIIVRFDLIVNTAAGIGLERHKIQLSGSLAEYVRDYLNKNDPIELTGKIKPRDISYLDFNDETVIWTAIRKLEKPNRPSENC